MGDFANARIAIMLETPSVEEVGFSVLPPSATLGTRQVLGTIKEAQAELLRRTKAYPNVPAFLRARGVPVVGRTGALLNRLLRQAGIDRDSIAILNSLRCFPVKSKKGDTYPTGADKSIAQYVCRQYDQIGDGPGKFLPDVVVISMHPAALFKDGASSAEPLILADLEKAASFAKDGLRVLVVMGGHAAEVVLGFGTNVSKWRGHYEWIDASFLTKRLDKLKLKSDKARRVGMPKVAKKSKTQLAREELAKRIFAVLEELGLLRMNADAAVYQKGLDNIVAALTPPKRVKTVTIQPTSEETFKAFGTL